MGDHEVTTATDGSSGLPVGVQVRVATTPLGNQLVAENTTGQELEVLAANGQPFLRIGPRGVLANLRSPAWYRSNSPPSEVPDSELRIPAGARPGAKPVWGRLTRERSWGWFDPVLVAQPSPGGGSKPAHRFGSWRVAMRHGGRPAEVHGHFELVAAGGAVTSRLVSQPEGVDVRLLPGRRPALLVSATGDRSVQVLGVQGEPFLRLGPGGTDANEASPTWRSLEQQSGGGATAAAAGSPRWRHVSDSARYAWTDPRASSAGIGSDARRRWSVPVVAGDRRMAIVGETAVGPPPAGAAAQDGGDGGRSGPGTLIAIVALSLVTLGAVVALARLHGRRGPATMTLMALGAAALAVAGCGGSGDGAGPVAAPAAGATPAADSTPPAPVEQWPLPADPMRRAVDARLVPTRRETLDNHAHSQLYVYIDGRPVQVPPGIGIDVEAKGVRTFLLKGGRVAYGGIRCADACISPLHTHDDSGIVHTESRLPQPHRLGQLFTEWGVRLTPRCVGDLCAPSHPVAVYVNGRPYAEDPRGVVLEDRSVIAIAIGKPPAQVPSTADFSSVGG